MSQRNTNDARSDEGSGGHQLVQQVAPLTDRVNVEPPILNGMTASEAKYVGLVALALSLVVGGLVAALTGIWQILLGAAIFGPLSMLWVASNHLASFKRNRPDGYYMQWLRIQAARRGIGRMAFIDHDGAWDLGRPL